MVSKLLVPVMKRFGGEELAWLRDGTVWKSPILPEGSMDAIQPETLLSLLGIRLKVPGINVFRNRLKLTEGEGR